MVVNDPQNICQVSIRVKKIIAPTPIMVWVTSIIYFKGWVGVYPRLSLYRYKWTHLCSIQNSNSQHNIDMTVLSVFSECAEWIRDMCDQDRMRRNFHVFPVAIMPVTIRVSKGVSLTPKNKGSERFVLRVPFKWSSVMGNKSKSILFSF